VIFYLHLEEVVGTIKVFLSHPVFAFDSHDLLLIADVLFDFLKLLDSSELSLRVEVLIGNLDEAVQNI